MRSAVHRLRLQRSTSTGTTFRRAILFLLLCSSSLIAQAQGVPPAEEPALAKAKMAVRLKDFTKAVRIWRGAANQGSSEAQYRIGVAYRSGLGVERNNTKAAFWFQKAAKGGNTDGQYALGELYKNGIGVERDRSRAMELISRAARGGHPKAKKALTRIQSSGSIAYATAGGRIAANQADPRAALNQAIRSGDLESAREALARGAPVNGAPGDSKFWRPLILAIDRDRPRMVKELLAYHADPNQKSRLGEPALVLATRDGNLTIVRQLLSAGSHPKTRALGGYTPLMEAARSGSAKIVDNLLAAGSDPTDTLADGTSAADIARRYRFKALALRLGRAGAPTREQSATATRLAVLASSERSDPSRNNSALPLLIEAARRGDTPLLREILASGVPFDVRDSAGDSALHHAADGGHFETIKALLKAGVSPDLRGQNESTALMRAMSSHSKGSDQVVAILLSAGADPHSRDRDSAGLIDYAAEGATHNKLKSIAEAGASWTASAVGSSLERAAAEGRLDVVRALHAVARRPRDRAAALCGAITSNHKEVLEFLLEKTLKIPFDCGSKRSALLLAVAANRPMIVEALLKRGANPNQNKVDGDTVLIAAANRGYTQIALQLLQSGANIDYQGSHGLTALMAAAANGHADFVRALLKAGSDRRVRNDSNRTALDLAEAADHKEVAEAIESFRTKWRNWFTSADKP